MEVLGREATAGPVGHIGAYRAADGSAAARVGFDLNGPHIGAVVGKRGYGKSYTLGVFAEELADVPEIAPVVIDPMGTFAPLAEASIPASVVTDPAVPFDAVPPAGICELAGIDPHTDAGAVLWRVAAEAPTLAAAREQLAAVAGSEHTRRVAENYLSRLASWGLFKATADLQAQLAADGITVFDCRTLAETAIDALSYVIATRLYRWRATAAIDRLPWLLIDEAHAVCDGIAATPIERIATRGRQPGVSLVLATQRPAALPAVVTSQADFVAAHRLTATADRRRLEEIAPTYLTGDIGNRLPEAPGDVLFIDDTTEAVHQIRIRSRKTPHGGETPTIR